MSWRGAAIVANVDTAQPIELASRRCSGSIAVGAGFVTRIFGLHDDPKRGWNSPDGTFMNQRWPDWLAAAGIDPELLWPNVPAAARTLWNARLYPIAANRDDSLALTLPLQDTTHASADWRAKWEASPRLSLAASFVGADSERILSDLIQIEDYVAARHFYAAIQDQQPAAEARTADRVSEWQHRAPLRLIDSWLAQADPILQLRGYKALADGEWTTRVGRSRLHDPSADDRIVGERASGGACAGRAA